MINSSMPGTGKTIGENATIVAEKAKAVGTAVLEKADGLSNQFTGKTVEEHAAYVASSASAFADKVAYDTRAMFLGARYSRDAGPTEKAIFDEVRAVTTLSRPHGTHGLPLTEIVPGLYTCHFDDISSTESVGRLDKNIGLVVNSACPHSQNETCPGFCNTYPGFYGPNVTVFLVDLLDDPKIGETHLYPGDAKQYFRTVNEKISEALAAGKGVIVHCYGSISRSSALIISFLMESKSIGIVEATAMMKAKWDATWPNDSFVRQLIEFDQELQRERALNAVR